MRLSLIAAIGSERQLGKDNQLLWKLPSDLKFFKEKTLNHTIVMGRKTFESIGKALPKRHNVVITSDKNFVGEGIEVLDSPMMVFDMGLEIEEKMHHEGLLDPDDQLEIFIIGGGTLYEFFLPYANTIYLTEVNYEGEADVFFPMISPEEWVVDSMSDWQEENGFQFRFLTLERE